MSEQNRPPPKHLSMLVNNNTTLNLNIASYFLNILASPDESTWNTTGGTITIPINCLGLTTHHRRTVEIMWLIVYICKDMELQYTGKILKSTLVNLTFLILDELNILADAMENHLGLCYKTHMMNCHSHHGGFNVVCKSAVNLDSLRLQPIRV